MSDNKTEPYTPTTDDVRTVWTLWKGRYSRMRPHESDAEFDRWYVQEIEKAEYSGYLRAVREGLHR